MVVAAAAVDGVNLRHRNWAWWDGSKESGIREKKASASSTADAN